MISRYNLNLKLYEIGVVLDNVARWKGLVELKNYIIMYKNKLSLFEYEMLSYGVSLIAEGNDPKDVQFFLSEEVERVKIVEKENYELHRDLRLIVKFIDWIQNGQHQNHKVLLKYIDDKEVKAQYNNWILINEFDTNITFEKSKEITTQEWLQIRDSNIIVKDYYDNQMTKINK